MSPEAYTGLFTGAAVACGLTAVACLVATMGFASKTPQGGSPRPIMAGAAFVTGLIACVLCGLFVGAAAGTVGP